MNWDELVFGVFSQTEIQHCVAWEYWQMCRRSMLGTDLEYKWRRLKCFLTDVQCSSFTDDDRKRARICVTNYVNALKRGGLIK
jgi:hypothetical protein